MMIGFFARLMTCVSGGRIWEGRLCKEKKASTAGNTRWVLRFKIEAGISPWLERHVGFGIIIAHMHEVL